MDRKDSWTVEDDLLLAETVIDHIKTGSTQLAAFEEVGARLDRTAAACGFRWNSTVRKQYEDTVKEAKIQRSAQKKVKIASVIPMRKDDAVGTGENVIKKHIQEVIHYIEKLEHTIKLQQEEIEDLNNKLAEEKSGKIASEDLDSLMHIILRAKEMGTLNKAN
ncbi:RsfA family transcriptional regulator [Paenibacillus aurantius]|uniref:RsfA family transcriptional regulator n=1 Tax=Paenibacillus aurantius TaxID=2918900 RepID=A0AA96LAL1_9BACL|nr:RsfA family transcriptional regulator [Paenibacillus aurantius]WNQ09608.1 RsfA family transcriptional regulator [Paenibacillus aurantius]